MSKSVWKNCLVSQLSQSNVRRSVEKVTEIILKKKKKCTLFIQLWQFRLCSTKIQNEGPWKRDELSPTTEKETCLRGKYRRFEIWPRDFVDTSVEAARISSVRIPVVNTSIIQFCAPESEPRPTGNGVVVVVVDRCEFFLGGPWPAGRVCTRRTTARVRLFERYQDVTVARIPCTFLRHSGPGTVYARTD